MPPLLLVFAVALLLVCFLARQGLSTPYIGGGLGLFIAHLYNVSYNITLFLIISLYIGALLSNTRAEAEGNSTSMTALLQGATPANPLTLLTTKTIFLILFVFLPIPKPPFFISGIYALILIASLLYHGNHNYSSFWRTIEVAMVTCGSFALVFLLGERVLHIQNPSLAIISAVAIPYILLGQHEPEDDDYDVDLGCPAVLSGLALVFLTPGYSTSSVSASFFLPGSSQTVGNSLLEGATEGWVLHLILSNQLSGKSPLGDILQINALEWGTFTPTTSTFLMVGLAIISGCAVSWGLALLNKNETPSYSQGFTTIAILLVQAIATAGLPLTICYVAVGLACYAYKTWRQVEPSSISSIVYISPMLF